MDVRLQAKLLRVIQEREIDRLGGTAPIKVNVRILATSNRDLPAEVAAGRFRDDLYFRLNVISLRIPSLRERPADVAVLADHYARRYADVNGMPMRPLSTAAHARLAAHGWRGNVRELETLSWRRSATPWATAPMPRPSWASPYAPCGTSCATTPNPAPR